MNSEIVIGIPFYDKEGSEVFSACRDNITNCLDIAEVRNGDAEVHFIVNGKETSEGKRTVYETRDSRIKVRYSDKAGQIPAINFFTHWADEEGIPDVIITDADIYRRPDCLIELRKAKTNGKSVDLVGANHFVYPLSWIESRIELSPEERFWYQVFEGDKDIRILPILQEYRFSRITVNRNRVKGSLMLVDTKVATSMHSKQVKVSDSVINNSVLPERRKIADTRFYHMGRTSLEDHILARLRHFQGAKAEGFDLKMYQREILPETEEELDEIADVIRDQVNQEAAEYFLLRCALRNLAADYCFNFVNGKRFYFDEDASILPEDINSYAFARKFVGSRLDQLAFDKSGSVINGIGITQTELPRSAIDCESFV